jgi:Holliday junction resolvase RusA-like endonuclease
MILKIELKPISWNVLARKNHWKYTEIFNEWKMATLAALNRWERGHGKVGLIEVPVNARYHASWKANRRHDIDSLCIKPVQDFLVERGILADDDLKHVKMVSFTGETGAVEDCLYVRIIPIT